MTKCTECKQEISSGIWVESKFKDSSLLLFCTEKCKKEYIRRKIEKIKTGYPEYYKKEMKRFETKGKDSADFLEYAEKHII